MDFASGDFSCRQSGFGKVVGVLSRLGNLVCPELGVIGGGVDSCRRNFVCDGGTSVGVVLGKVIDLSDLLFLRDAESSGSYP